MMLQVLHELLPQLLLVQPQLEPLLLCGRQLLLQGHHNAVYS
jgi:hypothetical protein